MRQVHGRLRVWPGGAIGMVALFGAVLSLSADDSTDPIMLPTQFVDDRFFVVPTLSDGSEIRLLADTGGGMYFFADSAGRLKLKVRGVNENDYKGLACDFPDFANGKGIPKPLNALPFIPIAPAPVRLNISWITSDIDGMLGEAWFAGRVWTFDYVDRQLIMHPGGLPKMSDRARRIDMGLKGSVEGNHPINYPRIEITVDGEKIPVLLATGSSIALSAGAMKVLGDGPAIRGVSLISNSRFDEWRKKHPDWKHIPDAEERSGEPIIEVPEVIIAGVSVGPVWFAQRADSNFRETFSEWTDQPIDGALGPNALRGLRVTLDYPAHSAWLEKP